MSSPSKYNSISAESDDFNEKFSEILSPSLKTKDSQTIPNIVNPIPILNNDGLNSHNLGNYLPNKII